MSCHNKLMKHVCIRDFQRNFYKHIDKIDEPLTVTRYGQPVFTINAINSVAFSDTAATRTNEELLPDYEKTKTIS